MNKNISATVSLVLLLTACQLVPQVKQQTRIDEVPMYADIDRSKIPETKEADEKFISGVSAQFGSREKASAIWVNQGFKFYQQDNLGMAMRRFNQAWLFNPENPEVYAGFGSILYDQGKYCDAMKMMDKAILLNPPAFQGIYTDAGRIFTLCAVRDFTLNDTTKAKLLVRSEELYKKAEDVEPNKQYLYSSWASAYYWRGQYLEAWHMIAKERGAGGKPNDKFLSLLREKMPESNRKLPL